MPSGAVAWVETKAPALRQQPGHGLHRERVCVVAQPTREGPVANRGYPADLAELRAWFPSDSACVDCLDWLRWPEGFRCPHCGAADAGRDHSGRYRCKGCRRRVSVTAGTIFDKTRIPMTVWFEAVWLVTADKGGVSAAHLHRVLPISSYPTAWAMLARLRQVMGAVESTRLFRYGRGRRDLHRRSSRRQSRSWRTGEDARGQGDRDHTPRVGACPPRRDPGRVGAIAERLRHDQHRAGHRRDHRRVDGIPYASPSR